MGERAQNQADAANAIKNPNSQSAATGGPKGPKKPEDPENGKETKIEQGKSQAPKEGQPESIYEQIGNDGKVKSRTFYDKNGRQFARQDFEGSRPHKINGEDVIPHEHLVGFNPAGQRVVSETVKRIAEGYTNVPTL